MIGIIVLTVVIGFKKPDSDVPMVLLRTAAFFVLALLLGLLLKVVDRKKGIGLEEPNIKS